VLVLPRPARDAVLPVVIFALGTLELAASGYPSWGWGVVCLGAACAVLVGRRRFPLLTGCAAAAALATATVIEPTLEDPATPIAVLVLACYGFARYRDDLWGLSGIALMVLSAMPRYFFLDADAEDITDAFFVGALLIPPFLFGRVARKLDQQTRLLEEQQEALQRQAVRDERNRIAREMHDVIAHSISAMVVQTSAAQDLLQTDPGRVGPILEGVTSTGRRALTETARLLHLIRDDADELGLQPVPGLADLDRLVEGTDVELHRTGQLTGLPNAVDVSAYRIVQEAVTNARRYGEGPVSVSVERQNGAVRIRAANAVGTGDPQGGGLGLLGMAERASVLGGTLTHGVRDGRFELEAVLPVVEA
jgi:signal transduction histidine kinase